MSNFLHVTIIIIIIYREYRNYLYLVSLFIKQLFSKKKLFCNTTCKINFYL